MSCLSLLSERAEQIDYYLKQGKNFMPLRLYLGTILLFLIYRILLFMFSSIDGGDDMMPRGSDYMVSIPSKTEILVVNTLSKKKKKNVTNNDNHNNVGKGHTTMPTSPKNTEKECVNPTEFVIYDGF